MSPRDLGMNLQSALADDGVEYVHVKADNGAIRAVLFVRRPSSLASEKAMRDAVAERVVGRGVFHGLVVERCELDFFLSVELGSHPVWDPP